MASRPRCRRPAKRRRHRAAPAGGTPDDDFDAYLTAREAAEAQYAEALFDMAIAYAEELPFIYDALFGDDYDDDAVGDPMADKVEQAAHRSPAAQGWPPRRQRVTQVEQAAHRSPAAQGLVVELAALATVPCDDFQWLAETLAEWCRAGAGLHQELSAVLDLIEVCKDYEEAMADALEAHHDRDRPRPTAPQGELAPTAPRTRRCRRPRHSR